MERAEILKSLQSFHANQQLEHTNVTIYNKLNILSVKKSLSEWYYSNHDDAFSASDDGQDELTKYVLIAIIH
ncbi:MAG: hypothetical protein GKR87_08525 [Kiritimatiellae bacterium]|nr:hypothetical protein [Kiritimatiellia bacterium]